MVNLVRLRQIEKRDWEYTPPFCVPLITQPGPWMK